jgi:dTDP-4-dehydrorhamnose 3,5-epimerase-like enzyme
MIIDLPNYSDDRGDLTVIEKILPFDIKRVYFISNTKNQIRGRHRHKKTIQAAICISGSCKIFMDNGEKNELFQLNNKSKCLIINPEDFHWMSDFSEDAILLVLASEEYDKNDYIYEPY